MSESDIRVLHLEDNPADADLVRDLLTEIPDSGGLRITNCVRLEEALKLSADQKFEIVIMDLNLPDSEGLSTFRRYQAKFPDNPVVVVTALDLEEVGVEAVRAGAQDYLIKNQLSGHMIHKTIKYALERKAIQSYLKESRDMLRYQVDLRTRELSQTLEALAAKERHVREGHELLQSIIDGIEAALFFVDPCKMEIVKTNAVAERMLGREAGELVGGCCTDLLCFCADEARRCGCPHIGRRLLSRESTLRTRDGSFLPVLKNILPVTMDGRELLVEIVFDIGQRKELERRLNLAQKMESVGQLAAGIAHELNTPVQFIASNLTFVSEVMADLHEHVEQMAGFWDTEGQAMAEGERLRQDVVEEVPRALKDALDGVHRIIGIVRAMKEFSHPGTGEKESLDINRAILNTLTIAKNEYKYYATVHKDLADDIPSLTCYPGDINQVLLNVIVNAAQAIAEKMNTTGKKGRITLRTRNMGEYVEIQIEDDGVGIRDEHKHVVFDPFFTTKGVGKGTGQGLAISYSLVEKAGGTIDFESRPGRGTVFTIALPYVYESGKEQIPVFANNH